PARKKMALCAGFCGQMGKGNKQRKRPQTVSSVLHFSRSVKCRLHPSSKEPAMPHAVCTGKKTGCALLGFSRTEDGRTVALILFCGVPCLVVA
ncbi:MAG TPA: hypothetical protein PLN94_16460, partial [Thiolinea sp.]|nr:hypothetical protein [Thiolinea sp.]